MWHWPQYTLLIVGCIWTWQIGSYIHQTPYMRVKFWLRAGLYLATVLALQLALRARGFW